MPSPAQFGITTCSQRHELCSLLLFQWAEPTELRASCLQNLPSCPKLCCLPTIHFLAFKLNALLVDPMTWYDSKGRHCWEWPMLCRHFSVMSKIGSDEPTTPTLSMALCPGLLKNHFPPPASFNLAHPNPRRHVATFSVGIPPSSSHADRIWLNQVSINPRSIAWFNA